MNLALGLRGPGPAGHNRPMSELEQAGGLRQVAQVAATLVVEEGLEYGPAKRRAVKQLGLPARTALPDNDLVEAAVREHIALFCADTQPAELKALRELALGCWSQVCRFGGAGNDFSARGEPSDFEVLKAGQPVARLRWALGGVHNQLNALAALAAAEHVGVAPSTAAQALTRFENVKRRMEVRGKLKGITVYDDFAHHPTAIHTTIDGLRRQVGPSQRILAVFEPRSNTMKLGAMKAQLPWSLEQADLAFCHSGALGWDAREALAPMGERAQVADSIEQLLAQVLQAARDGDHILCMSNGSFGGIHQRLLDALAR